MRVITLLLGFLVEAIHSKILVLLSGTVSPDSSFNDSDKVNHFSFNLKEFSVFSLDRKITNQHFAT